MAKNTGKGGDKAGRNDTPKDAREGRKVERDERRINEANASGKSAREKLEDLLREDDE